MKISDDRLYPSSVEEAKKAQYQMAGEVSLLDSFPSIQWVGGMDVSNNLYDPDEMVYASAVVLDFPQLQVAEQAVAVERQTFPYIPGLLGFREAPALLHAFSQLKIKPDILMIDGHGISHPRGLGIASHIGVLLDIPTIGVAKSILAGKPASLPGPEPGSQAPLIWKNQTIGMLVRTKKRANPLIVSPGHRISLETAVEIVRKCLRGYRLPETTRQAHLAANASRKQRQSL